MAPSLFRFRGRIQPGQIAIGNSFMVNLEYEFGKVNLGIQNGEIIVECIADRKSFESLFKKIDEAINSFFAAQTLLTYFPLSVIWEGWDETPLDTTEGADNTPVHGIVMPSPNLDLIEIPSESFLNMVNRGLETYKLLEQNVFYRRAVKDFNYALQQPTSEKPVYLYRAIESAEVYFDSEKEMKASLKCKKEMDLVGRLANDASQGIHTRHASRQENSVILTNEQIMEAVKATAVILQKFQLWLLNEPARLRYAKGEV